MIPSQASHTPIKTETDGSSRPPKLVAEIRKEGRIINDLKTYEEIKQTIPSH